MDQANLMIGVKLAIDNIKEQVQAIENKIKQKIKLNVDLNTDNIATKIKQTQAKIQQVVNSPIQNTQAIQKVTQNMSNYEKSVSNLIQKYKMKQIADEDFIKTANRIMQHSKFQTLSDQKQLHVLQQLTTAENNYNKSLADRKAVRGSGYSEAIKINQQMDKTKRDAQSYEQWWLQSLQTREQREKQVAQKTAQDYEKFWLKALQAREQHEKQIVERTIANNNKVYNALANQRKKEADAVASFANWQKQMEGKFNTLQTGRTRTFVNPQELNAAKTQLDNLIADFGRLGSATPQLRQHMQSISNEFRRISTNANEAGRSGFSFIDMIVTAGKKMVIWLGMGTVIFQSLKQIQDGIQYIYNMNKAITELSKVTTFSKQELNNMKDIAISMGKELGKSSVEIMKSFAEFGRVSKDMESIKELAVTATTTSNVTSMTADVAAKAINTTMIAFKMNAKDSMKILDQWNELQNNYRISAEDMADSIGKVGAIAQQTGVSLNKLNAYTTAITSVTGLSGSEAGTALKTVFSRIFRIGEDGEMDAGKSEEELNKIGIAVRKSATEFRSAENIIDDVSEKWDTLTSIQQVNLAQVLAGKQMCQSM